MTAQNEHIRFYCGLNECNWNHHPMRPGPYACIAPSYGKTVRTKSTTRVTVPDEVQDVLVDSGAFSDRLGDRLSYEDALMRQLNHAHQFGYSDKIAHLASYDLLIDEKWQGGIRYKARWTKDEATFAVKETVAAAQYLAQKRTYLAQSVGHPVGLVLSAQGVETQQYLHCAMQIADMMEPGDIFGLGGWCITGLLPKVIFPSFCEIMSEVIPAIGKQGVKRVHIWGVIFPDALGVLLWLCDRYGISLSTDSSGPCRYPIFGQWGYGSWRDNAYSTPPVLQSCKVCDLWGNKTPICMSDTHCRGQERARHVGLTAEWLARFAEQEPQCYHDVQAQSPYQQMTWMEEQAS